MSYFGKSLWIITLLLCHQVIGQQKIESPLQIVDIDSNLELFTDYYLIDTLIQSEIKLHHPIDKGSVLEFDKPWEGPFSAYCTVIKSKDKFQLYYRGVPKAGDDGNTNENTCYAESSDGIHWTKPELGIFEINGSKKNNVVLSDAAPVTHNFSPFIDAKYGIDSKSKYKALGGTKKSGLMAYVSEDGIYWNLLQKEPVFVDGLFDSQNVSFWSEKEQLYICYFRTWSESGFNGYRSVGRTTSKNFLDWSVPVDMEFGNTPREHLYTNQTAPYFRAPHLYVSIAARFMPNRQVLTDEQARQLDVDPKYFKDCSDAVLMTSRGGNQYDRTFMEGFIRPGIGLKNWVSRSNYPALNVVQTGADEMSIYVNQDYAQPTAHLHRYALRLDGFTSINASYKEGEMITKPFRFKGNELIINFSTSAAGYIRVELLDLKGTIIKGFELDHSNQIIGNEIEKVVSWKNNPELVKLNNQPIRLRFVLKDADLYSLKFK